MLDLNTITKDQIIEKLPTPFDAIEAMIKGLERFSDHPQFTVDMITFGSYYETYSRPDGGVCFGCAATCTLMDISGGFSVDKVKLLGTLKGPKDLVEFEYLIDAVRATELHSLWAFYDFVPIQGLDYLPPSYFLGNRFQKSLGKWKDLVAALRLFHEHPDRDKLRVDFVDHSPVLIRHTL